MVERLYVVHADGTDPFENLALEELLTRDACAGAVTLYLWQNRRTVVIGRNQNAWQECRVAALEADGGRLARRLSGGGAVFHDLGNLNFTFVAHRDDYDVSRQLAVILRAVRSFGVQAELSGRNDLTADGQKFSGNAFYQTTQGCYHHGTLLLDADMEQLSRYLSVSVEKLASKGVDSVRARVVNLHALAPEITLETMRDAMHRAFGAEYGGVPRPYPRETIDADAWRELREKYASWDWRLGRATPFTFAFARRFDWGGVEFQLAVEGGRVRDCRVYSDAMDARLIAEIPARLTGQVCSSAALAAALVGDSSVLDDLRCLILEQSL